MPQTPRIVLPDVPMHITQRGVDRDPTFLTSEDFAFYRWALHQAQDDGDCAVHAYVLMSNHVHLLLTPADAGAPAKLMMSVGRRYVRYFNDRYQRTGTLWEGRYRSALVTSGAYLFACSRYIEMNPVRAGLAATPGAYEWSSFGHNGTGRDDPCIREHTLYGLLAATREARCAAYRAMFESPEASEVVATLRAAQRARPKLYTTPYRQAVETLRAEETGTASHGWRNAGQGVGATARGVPVASADAEGEGRCWM